MIERFMRFIFRCGVQQLSLPRESTDREGVWLLFVITARRRAKVPKDRVFAVLALMGDETQNLVDVDYSKSDAQVFQGIL
jgi:hypothetical protein